MKPYKQTCVLLICGLLPWFAPLNATAAGSASNRCDALEKLLVAGSWRGGITSYAFKPNKTYSAEVAAGGGASLQGRWEVDSTRCRLLLTDIYWDNDSSSDSEGDDDPPGHLGREQSQDDSFDFRKILPCRLYHGAREGHWTKTVDWFNRKCEDHFLDEIRSGAAGDLVRDIKRGVAHDGGWEEISSAIDASPLMRSPRDYAVLEQLFGFLSENYAETDGYLERARDEHDERMAMLLRPLVSSPIIFGEGDDFVARGSKETRINSLLAMVEQHVPFSKEVDEELSHLSVDALFVLRNAPFAAVKRPFKNNALNQYFYDRRIDDVDAVEQAAAEKRLSDIDRANVAMVVREWERRKALKSSAEGAQPAP